MKFEIIILFVINLVSGAGYSLVSPLFPSIAVKVGLSDSSIGFIISSYAIANLIATPFSRKVFYLLGKKNVLFYAVVIESICTVCFGLIEVIQNKFALSVISFALRFTHGAASTMTSILVYSIGICISEKKEYMKTLGFLELGLTIGISGGPICASYLYYIGGFKSSFIFFGIAIGVFSFLIHKLDIEDSEENEEGAFFSYLLNPTVLLIFISIVLDFISKTFYFPTLTNHLRTKFNLGVEISSLFFGVNIISYFLSLSCINQLTEKFGLIRTVLMGIAINVMCVLFLPPVDFLYQSPFTILFGIFISGISAALINIPAVCLMISIFEEIDSSDGGKDLATSIWNLSINIGDSLGPSLGGVISGTSDFATCCFSISFMNLAFAFVFYFYFNSKNLKERKIHEKQERNGSLVTYKTSKTERMLNDNELNFNGANGLYSDDFIDGAHKPRHQRKHSNYSIISSLSVNTQKSRNLLRKMSDDDYGGK